MFKKDIESNKIDVNTTDKKGFTLMHIATKRDNPKAIAILLQQKQIDPNMKNHEGNSAIMEACRNAKAKALEALLRSDKVDLDDVDDDHNSIEDLVGKAKVGLDTQNMLLLMIEKRRTGTDLMDKSGRHAVIARCLSANPKSMIGLDQVDNVPSLIGMARSGTCAHLLGMRQLPAAPSNQKMA